MSISAIAGCDFNFRMKSMPLTMTGRVPCDIDLDYTEPGKMLMPPRAKQMRYAACID